MEKVLEYFRSNRDSLCSLKYTVRSQAHKFHYSPVHLAVVFNTEEILQVLYDHMKTKQDREFARQVLTLRVIDADDDEPTRSVKDTANPR